MNDETRERIARLMDWSKRAIHVGFIPLIIYLGFTATFPRPSFIKIISPLAA
ncbi:translocase of the outer mitochondrial membrane [Polyrhizophydium stewartii]|uniref:Translocase of the outer mitochondrial membrane n=1 Tax=Polyrhizophydium stewartii TaxID=2732419 RepID=A0ABR4MZX5_9FUNG|nr:hypothetical protein HK105_002472 [Polyrhizophydium stewartii]